MNTEEIKKRIKESQANVDACRKFIEKHSATIDAISEKQFYCSMYGWNSDLDIQTYSNDKLDFKSIAALFGADGWTRKFNPTACGSIDWHKTVDGINITLKNAEQVKPTLIEEVKL